jgi:hypothetical protein
LDQSYALRELKLTRDRAPDLRTDAEQALEANQPPL